MTLPVTRDKQPDEKSSMLIESLSAFKWAELHKFTSNARSTTQTMFSAQQPAMSLFPDVIFFSPEKEEKNEKQIESIYALFHDSKWVVHAYFTKEYLRSPQAIVRSVSGHFHFW